MKFLNTEETSVYMAESFVDDVAELIAPYKNEKIFVLTDESTFKLCFPLIKDIEYITEENTIVIGTGDENKDVRTLEKVWQFLVEKGASRHSLLLNLGGGMPCDLGGFAAATFKRGIDFINIPTTLLAQVDASVGGKTGINFGGYKNEIGSFMQAKKVLVDIDLLKTLDSENLISGFAEMIKHAILDSDELLDETLSFDIENPNFEELKELVAKSIKIKDHYVTTDPHEKNIRKALNLGHTIGHAFESLALERKNPVLHGYAVAFGLIPELYLAHKKLGFPLEILEKLTNYINKIYGKFDFDESDFQWLHKTISHDKKNQGGNINFTLMKKCGEVAINTHCEKNEVEEALKYYINS